MNDLGVWNESNWQQLGDIAARLAKEAARKQFELQAGLSQPENEKDSPMAYRQDSADGGVPQ